MPLPFRPRAPRPAASRSRRPSTGLLAARLAGLLPAACLALAAAGEALAAGAAGLRQQVVHVAYNEGDFDEVIREIEAFTWTHTTWSRSDSLFIAKHLGVVYAAGAETRERGRAHLARLLEMQPDADLGDMFVSDEIAKLFASVRAEMRSRRPSASPETSRSADPAHPPSLSSAATASASGSAPGPTAPSRPASAPPAPFYRRQGFWWAAGAGAAALGAAGAVAAWAHVREEPRDASIRIGGESDPAAQ